MLVWEFYQGFLIHFHDIVGVHVIDNYGLVMTSLYNFHGEQMNTSMVSHNQTGNSCTLPKNRFFIAKIYYL